MAEEKVETHDGDEAVIDTTGTEVALEHRQAGDLAAPRRDYVAAIEMGHVLAQSGFFKDARDPAKAAVKVMIGMDIGLSPTASLTNIHAFDDGDGKTSWIIEGKMLGAIIKSRPGYDYQIVERDETKCTIRFFKDGKPVEDPAGPDVTYTIEDAKKAKLTSKKNWERHPREMLTWRCLAEGQRLFFPELTGTAVYVEADFGEEVGDMRQAQTGPQAAKLTDARSESQRATARKVYDELKELNPDRLPAGRFAQMVANAEHSHESLDSVIDTVEDLRATEEKIVDLKSQLKEEMKADDFRSVVSEAEGQGSQRDRIAVLEKALNGEGS